jgi:two-component system sensor histidine kinase DctS
VLVLQVRRAASSVSSSAEHSWVEFSVSDVGVGIAEDVARQLFTPFFTTKVEGMGLGLSLCRTVVEQHRTPAFRAPGPPGHGLSLYLARCAFG